MNNMSCPTPYVCADTKAYCDAGQCSRKGHHHGNNNGGGNNSDKKTVIIVVCVLVPLFFVIVGALVWVWRRRTKEEGEGFTLLDGGAERQKWNI